MILANYLLKSKILQAEIKSFLLVAILIITNFISLNFALQKDPLLVIAIDESGRAQNLNKIDPNLERKELLSFIKEFLDNYYSYNSSSFLEKMEKSTELMSQNLFESKREDILSISKKLTEFPINQSFEILKIDQTNRNEIEVELQLKITSRLSEKILPLKVTLNLQSKERSAQNPYSYEISEIKE